MAKFWRKTNPVPRVPLLHRTGEATALAGPAGFEGTVLAHALIFGPCSEQPCVYFETTTEKLVKERRGLRTVTRWKHIATEQRGSVFVLDDGSGPITVNALLPLDGDLQVAYAGAPKKPVPWSAAPGELVLDYRVTERVIPDGARLYALGHADHGLLLPPPDGKLVVAVAAPRV